MIYLSDVSVVPAAPSACPRHLLLVGVIAHESHDSSPESGIVNVGILADDGWKYKAVIAPVLRVYRKIKNRLGDRDVT